MTGAQDAIPRTTVAASQATLLNCLALARRRDTEGVALLELDRRRRAADGTAGGQQVEVVGLGRDATGAGGAAHSPVKHARPDDDCRSDVEVGLGSATGSEDVELSVLPVLRQIEDTVRLQGVDIVASRLQRDRIHAALGPARQV